MSRLIMQITWVAMLCLFLTHSALASGKGQTLEHSLDSEGIQRGYIVYNPVKSNSGKVPLMIVLHGGMGNAPYMVKTSKMNSVADTGNFIVAYPDGVGGRFKFMKNRRTWNAGRCCGQAVKKKVNDVLFIEKMINDIDSKYPIDTNRVYATGMSNGAMMAYRLACEIPEKIAAIIPVSGTLAIDNCDRGKLVPVLHIHGDNDKNVPFNGGKGPKGVSGVAHRSVPETIAIMTRSRQPIALETKNFNEGRTQITCYKSNNAASFTLITIKGGGHSWPGGDGRGKKESSGITDIIASQQAWDFAKQFSKNVEYKEKLLCQ